MVVPFGDAVELPPELELLDELLPDELEPPLDDELPLLDEAELPLDDPLDEL